jgi:protein-tyrosine-phosphatase
MNVLVLCTGNSARSILGEVILNTRGAGRLAAFSAGSQPKGAVHPGALRLLAKRGIDTAGLHSKIWNVFTDHRPCHYGLRQRSRRGLPGLPRHAGAGALGPA